MVRKVYAQLPRFDAEQQLVDHVVDELSDVFEFHRECWGTHCSGRRMRIDAIATPRDASGWKDPHPVFGLEFKLAGARDFQDTRDFTAWAAQTVDYTHVRWEGFGNLRIFACPSPVRYFSDEHHADPLRDPGFLMSRFLWQLGVGELAPLEGRDGPCWGKATMFSGRSDEVSTKRPDGAFRRTGAADSEWLASLDSGRV
ncbi:hypothetical protein [Microbacterium sp. NIBRBAC000506063]|uniref:hypothetical protein n=1 Tax=Microbacterium sp. NIBRBAC000506063 TaxID=2734618 RepID=UPI001BB48FAF|nr:hypothetical protein [Microbacterium sp. NIBRBAC000506063]QTV80411.1 hypothetical protein KAE78_05640 [Microbacterium sp. NIBRBAC000506063]